MSPDHSPTEAIKTIIDLEQRLATAWVTRDRPFIDSILAPDWAVTDRTGRVLSKQFVLDEAFSRTDRRPESMTVDDVEVRIIGEVAIATGRMRATGTVQGQSTSVALRFTDVFQRLGGQWRIVTSHDTIITPVTA
jgi:ketosteroid isomerase-like protein